MSCKCFIRPCGHSNKTSSHRCYPLTRHWNTARSTSRHPIEIVTESEVALTQPASICCLSEASHSKQLKKVWPSLNDQWKASRRPSLVLLFPAMSVSQLGHGLYHRLNWKIKSSIQSSRNAFSWLEIFCMSHSQHWRKNLGKHWDVFCVL